MLTTEQVAERTAYIGGSDIAAILGLSRFKTPLQVWAEKTGNLVPEDISHKMHVRLGNKLEATVCELFTEETGKAVALAPNVLFHPKYPYLRGRLDRTVVGENAVLEAKTTSAWNAKQWEGEEIPAEYILQTHWYMELGGFDRGYVACLVGNQGFHVKTLTRDDALQQEMVIKAVDFWTRYIEPKVMPSVVTSRDADTLYGLFPMGDDGEAVHLDDKANALIESIQAMKEDGKALESQQEKAENELRLLLGEHSAGVTDKFKVTWKNQQTNRIDLKKLREQEPKICAQFLEKSESRVLRINLIKPSK